jgi:hypothetical protein
VRLAFKLVPAHSSKRFTVHSGNRGATRMAAKKKVKKPKKTAARKKAKAKKKA